MLKIIINGCGGVMGKVLSNMVINASDIEIVAGVDPFNNSAVFPVYKTVEECVEECVEEIDVIIDFSRPESLACLLNGARQKKCPIIIATTGHLAEDKLLIEKHAMSFPVFHAANMSLGINLMTELLQKTASVLGDQYDIEIIEKHHNLKKDAPSGTAYHLADAINQVFMNSKKYVFDRHMGNSPRDTKEIGIHALRGGTIVGEHHVLFAGTDEIVEIRHGAYSKQVFAAGALQAARFIAGKSPGYYTMKDMITEESTITSLQTTDDEILVSLNYIPYTPKSIADIFKALGEKRINLDMISQTAPNENQVSITFTINRKDENSAKEVLEKLQKLWPELHMNILSEIIKITVQGAGIAVQSSVAAKVFEIMAKKDISLQAVTTSETEISYIIPFANRVEAIQIIKTTFGI